MSYFGKTNEEINEIRLNKFNSVANFFGGASLITWIIFIFPDLFDLFNQENVFEPSRISSKMSILFFYPFPVLYLVFWIKKEITRIEILIYRLKSQIKPKEPSE